MMALRRNGGYETVVAPVREPVTLDEVKDHLRISDDDSDGMLTSHILAARQMLESMTRRALITQTIDAYFDDFAPGLSLPFPPVSSVTAVYYQDSDDAEQTLGTGIYQADLVSEPAKILLSADQSWPTVYEEPQSVRVRFVCGYGTDPADVPEPLRQAIFFYVQQLYDADVRNYETVDKTIRALAARYVVYNV